MKGQGKPIWILVTLLLALVVGVTMYRLVAQTGSTKTFDEWMTTIDSDTATSQLKQICNGWYDANYAVDLGDAEGENLRLYAAKKGWLSKEEFEDEEDFTECDCSVFLYSQDLITRTNANKYYDADECHERANEFAEDEDLGRS